MSFRQWRRRWLGRTICRLLDHGFYRVVVMLPDRQMIETPVWRCKWCGVERLPREYAVDKPGSIPGTWHTLAVHQFESLGGRTWLHCRFCNQTEDAPIHRGGPFAQRLT